ncbi:NADPH-dependent 7-cyano-7-deazaguanine reductase QueF [Opacimonas viscosa]|uniref:NADPH-dependent 7-cyano-7-deazaguanine reductase n=1 Tax=Opacimonas viscosa TaxID=2961944 RepID=A0AA41X0Q8_9ALTE|nr:NADPH-dependent 7-cyano-7-deazaguanine reductase QueF [Opacimonas viscosa]MCP3427757.1 NADPH-dependent 7-cyano-7-deazaguanine reductase QueF [Opacimonas viscosa]
MPEYANKQAIQALTLGKTVEYKSTYAPELLQPVPRQLNRDDLALTGNDLPFHGNDLWNGYELSWLQPNGLPQIAILRCRIDAFSKNLVESKSFKLYLNSFNNSVFTSTQQVKQTLQKDLSECAQGEVQITIILPEDFHLSSFSTLPGQCIDQQDISICEYALNPKLLKVEEPEVMVTETLYSNLLKSNCLVTNQPDWASVVIKYKGPKIDQAALLRYIISFREHNEFHEQCVERIFMDLTQYCACEKLTVYARYTRRGGLDINPFRSNFEQPVEDLRTLRQ